MLNRESLTGVRFLDIGSGSGLFSLAARRLGATVHSFDFDPDSVNCTRALKTRFVGVDTGWAIERGSVLDADYMSGLGQFDVVYAWGVLHHTGDMWRAIANAAARVVSGGQLFVALYNDQGFASRMWFGVKWLYNVLPPRLRFLVLWPAATRLWAPTFFRDVLRHGDCLHTWQNYVRERGMSPWINVVDWVGGFPFEVARPEDVTRFMTRLGFRLDEDRLCGRGHGCNEFVFTRVA